MPRRRHSRLITVLAVGMLALDGALLVLAGLWSRRPGLVALGAAFGLGALLVVWSWRRHLRHLDDLRSDIEARRVELEQLQRDLERHRGN